MEEIIKKLISFFNITDTTLEINENEEIITINIRTENGRTLIGPDGTTLKDLELLVKALAQKNNIAKKIILDINNYRKYREEQLKKMAKETAHKVIITKKPIKLPPMNAYERRIIHLELAINPNVATESVGEEPNRCLIVKPYP